VNDNERRRRKGELIGGDIEEKEKRKEEN